MSSSAVWQMKMRRIVPGDIDYPDMLADRMGANAPPAIYAMGDLGVLRHQRLGLICSVRCPGSIVIKTYDAIRELRDIGMIVAGGFHSPMEHECLDILLRGSQPVILCPAKGLDGQPVGQECRRAVEEGRLLLLSAFGSEVKRTTAARAVIRNEFVAALSDVVLIPHASPGGKTEALARRAIKQGRPLFTFADEENAALIGLGARSLESHQIAHALDMAAQPRERRR
jgi:predicted Rossmann fold nucleotide-binding protein DprA/Smf involved in DNA uptake